jgi:hypothetical protein
MSHSSQILTLGSHLRLGFSIYADAVNLLSEKVNTVYTNTEALSDHNKVISLEVKM